MTQSPRLRATLRMRSLQKRKRCSQSDRWPLKALKRAADTTSSSQSGTSLLTTSSTAADEEEEGADELLIQIDPEKTRNPDHGKWISRERERPGE